MNTRDFLDRVISAFGLILLLPVFVLVALAVRWGGGAGPIIYRQERIGKDGKPFHLYKFRTMRIGSDAKGLLTVGGRDPRITLVGTVIRKYKLDELPQLWNVLKGDMSMVGPRPEVQKYVAHYTPEQRHILSVRPGITDFASIQFRQENELLVASPDPERTYIEDILPEKIRLNRIYIKDASVRTYFRILVLTVWKIFR